MSMVRSRTRVYWCPSCGATSVKPRFGRVPGKVRETVSLVDGVSYPSCARHEQLCYWCEVGFWGGEGERCMAFPTRPAAAASSGSSLSSALAAGPLKPYPELWDFLTTTVLADGGSRQTGRLSVCFESGVLKLSLTDDHTGQYASLSGRNLDDLIAEVELRLADGSLPWRPSNFIKGKRK